MGGMNRCRGDFIGGFLRVSEVFVTPVEQRCEISPWKGKIGYSPPPDAGGERHGVLRGGGDGGEADVGRREVGHM